MQESRISTRRLTSMAILVAMSLTMFLLESLIPMPILPPGAKLGLSNIIIIVALYILPSEIDALIILIVRIVLSSIFVGSPTVLMFSISGGLLSFIMMVIARRSRKFSIIGVSVVGGFFHNVGQILTAIFVMDSWQIVNYLTALGICGVFTGTLIGIVSNEVVKHIPNTKVTL